MVDPKDIPVFLDTLMTWDSDFADKLHKLSSGYLIQKTERFQYEIDDVNIDQFLGPFNKNNVPYFLIRHNFKFNFDTWKLNDLFSNDSVVPFSKVVKNRTGDDLECSIAFQLYAQKKGLNSYLVSGFKSVDGKFYFPYYFNIAISNNHSFVVDVADPLVDHIGRKSPFLVPIREMDDETHLPMRLILPKTRLQNSNAYPVNSCYSFFKPFSSR